MEKTNSNTSGGMTSSQFNSGRQRGICAGLLTSRFSGYVIDMRAPLSLCDADPSLHAAAKTGLSSEARTGAPLSHAGERVSDEVGFIDAMMSTVARGTVQSTSPSTPATTANGRSVVK